MSANYFAEINNVIITKINNICMHVIMQCNTPYCNVLINLQPVHNSFVCFHTDMHTCI